MKLTVENANEGGGVLVSDGVVIFYDGNAAMEAMIIHFRQQPDVCCRFAIGFEHVENVDRLNKPFSENRSKVADQSAIFCWEIFGFFFSLILLVYF